MLELLSIFAIEVIFLHVDIQNYTMQQRSIHCIIMVFMWAFFMVFSCFFQGSIIIFQKGEVKGIRFPRKVGS
ncbi:hypothetical protein C817_01552 [Dorea sp. 5-2]|nr:hypothetical protein C817_01552 [Dorea sp. 5-2]